MSNNKSTITLDVQLSEDKMPESITWSATQSDMNKPQDARAMLLGLWDANEKSALRIDLWTTKMMMDEMNDFFFQTFMGLADTYGRANKDQEIVKDIKAFAEQFYKKAQESIK
jgi:gliding motility-associated protein GldC